MLKICIYNVMYLFCAFSLCKSFAHAMQLATHNASWQLKDSYSFDTHSLHVYHPGSLFSLGWPKFFVKMYTSTEIIPFTVEKVLWP